MNIVFEPLSLEFYNFNKNTANFLISVRPTAILGKHTVSFIKNESS